MRFLKSGQLKYALETDIRKGIYPIGGKLPSYRELMERYNVSQGTVAKAFEKLMREKIIFSESGRGYFVVDPEHGGSGELADKKYVLVTLPNGEISYFTSILNGITHRLKENGRYPIVQLIESGVPEQCRNIQKDLCGLILTMPMEEDAILTLNMQGKIPTVFADFSRWNLRSCSSVIMDNVRGAMLAVRHLVSYGHKKILHLTGPICGEGSGAERMNGYIAEMKAQGLEPVCEYAGWGFEGGYYTLKKSWESYRPTAIFCTTDLCALGAVRAAKEMGLSIPGDLSVVGFNDLPEAQVSTIRLTTVRTDAAELGSRAAGLLEDLLEGKPPDHPVLPSILIERETVSRPFFKNNPTKEIK